MTRSTPTVRVAAYTAAALLAAALLLFAAVAVYALQPGLPRGVRLSGQAVGGLSLARFEAVLADRVRALEERHVTFAGAEDADGKLPRLADGLSVAPATLTLRELGVRTNADAIAARVRTLFAGSLWSRAEARWQLARKPPLLVAAFDDDALRQALERTWPQLRGTKPVDARRIVTADDRVSIVPEAIAYRADGAAVARLLAQRLAAEPWSSDAGQQAEPWSGDAGRQAEPLRLKLPLMATLPKVTAQSLAAQGVERKISEFATEYTDTDAVQGRNHNVRSAAQTIDDMLLAPGDVFDYAAVVKQTERTYGFREAPVIVDGKLVPGIGGGICQVSSTLYNAVLLAGLAIVERRNHTLPVSYVPLGQDATYADGYINFKFRNTSGHYVLIRTTMQGGRLTVKLFGTMAEGLAYDVASTVVRTIEPPNKYVYNPSLPRSREKTLQPGKSGYVVETYRYTKQNGVIVAQERISRDTYAAAPTLIATGKKLPVDQGGTGNAKPKSGEHLIEDGISGPKFQ